MYAVHRRWTISFQEDNFSGPFFLTQTLLHCKSPDATTNFQFCLLKRAPEAACPQLCLEVLGQCLFCTDWKTWKLFSGPFSLTEKAASCKSLQARTSIVFWKEYLTLLVHTLSPSNWTIYIFLHGMERCIGRRSALFCFVFLSQKLHCKSLQALELQ